MSEKPDADDFFGIEYMMSQPQKFSLEPEEKSANQSTSGNRSFRLKEDVDTVWKDRSQLSGTEYLDRAFFPQLELDQEPARSDENESSSDFFEKQFFRKVGSDSDVFDKLPMGSVREQAESHTRLSKEMHSHRTHNRTRTRTMMPKLEDESDSFDQLAVSGLEKILADLIPVWRLTEEEQVNLMLDRVLYKDNEIVAFDKPYGMSYSGSSKIVPQLDRLLQKIKSRVVPKCERLYLVKALDKHQSGIVLFATNATMQSSLRESFESGLVEQISRCIVRGELPDSPLKINIPLIKTVKNRDMKLIPLVSNKAKGEIYYVETICRTIVGNQYISSVEVQTRKEIGHQIRAHLALAGCPLVGDPKYSNCSPRPPRFSDRILNTLNITDSQSRKIPMYLHLKEILLPSVSASKEPTRISAPMPDHFKWMLKKLKLIKR